MDPSPEFGRGIAFAFFIILFISVAIAVTLLLVGYKGFKDLKDNSSRKSTYSKAIAISKIILSTMIIILLAFYFKSLGLSL
jgi:hypothetical protein